MKKSLIYSCSGCSSAAQMANAIAVRIDRTGVAEMSCIAGVGGDVPALVRVAKSGRDVTVIDGCPLQCARRCLERHGVSPRQHHILSNYEVAKIQHGDFDPKQAKEIFELVKDGIKTFTRE